MKRKGAIHFFCITFAVTESLCDRHLLTIDTHTEMHVSLLGTPCCRPILTEVEVCRQSLAELANLKFHENLYSGFTYVPTERRAAVNRPTFETLHCKHS